MSTALLNEAATADEAAILGLIGGMAKARWDKDVRTMAAPYESEAALFTLAPPLVHHGMDPVGTQAWLDTWDGPIEIEPRDMKVSVDGDLAFCYGYMRLSGQKKGSANQNHTVNFWMRETLCLRRDGDRWRIVHEHASVPFYMDGPPLGAFDLQP